MTKAELQEMVATLTGHLHAAQNRIDELERQLVRLEDAFEPVERRPGRITAYRRDDEQR